MRKSFNIWRWTPVFALVVACVDTVNISRSLTDSIIIVDGSITDEAGPYIVKITHAFPLHADTARNEPISGATVVLYSDKGESEVLIEEKAGEYQTTGMIRGTIGNTYHITLQMPDGSTFQSDPERLNAAGDIKAIKYAYEARTVTKSYGVLPADVFNVYADADADISGDSLVYMRWRFTGTYKTETFPQLHTTVSQVSTYKTPYECSGYVVDPGLNGGVLRQDTVCTCCICWVKEFETTPHLFNSELVSEGQFRNVKVGEVPISRATFVEKYYVALEQMAISRKAYDFFNIIRSQKDNASNLFQPTPGRSVGNIVGVNTDERIVGLFWAASIARGSIFIPKEAVPYKIATDSVPRPCTSYPNSSTTKPDFWDE